MDAQQLVLECYRFENAARRIAALELRKGGPRHLSPEDVVQDAYVRVLECWEQYDPAQGSVKSWFLRIVANCCQDSKRREFGQKKDRREFVGLDDISDLAEEDAPDPFPFECLTERQRQVMGLYVKGYGYEEIAGKLGLRRATVREHLYQARRRLRLARGYKNEEVVTW